jgi:hypothetical protein
MEENSEYVSKMMAQMVEATGVPVCFLCNKRIVGAHIDYMDKDRIPRKICVGCVFQALDYYIGAREKALKGEAK